MLDECLPKKLKRDFVGYEVMIYAKFLKCSY